MKVKELINSLEVAYRDFVIYKRQGTGNWVWLLGKEQDWILTRFRESREYLGLLRKPLNEQELVEVIKFMRLIWKHELENEWQEPK